MAARYWVGGTGTWDNVVTTNWAATSGGAGGASAPTATDNVIFDANSGTGTVTVTVGSGAACGGCVISGWAANVTFSLAGNPTWSAGVYSFQGASQAQPLLIQSNALGATRTLTINGTHGTHQDVHFMDITLAGTAGTLTGTRIGDALGNSGFTFTASATQTFVGGTFNWSNPAAWTSRVPLPQDDVIVNTTIAGTLSTDMTRLGRNIDFTGYTRALADVSASWSFGSVTFSATMTHTGNQAWLLAGRGSHTITCAGVGFTTSITLSGVGGTFTLVDKLIIANPAANLNINVPLTFNANNQDVQVGAVLTNSGIVVAFQMGTGTWTLTRTGTNTIFSIGSQTTVTGSPTIVIATTDATMKTFTGGGQSYGTLRYIAAGSGQLTLINANTFQNLDIECTTARTFSLQATVTQTVTGTLTLLGAAGQLLSLVSGTPGTAANINISPGGRLVSNQYVSLSADVHVYQLFAPAGAVGTATVAATLTRIRARTASTAGKATVAASLVRTRARTASTAGHATVTANVARFRGLAVASAGQTTVTIAVSLPVRVLEATTRAAGLEAVVLAP